MVQTEEEEPNNSQLLHNFERLKQAVLQKRPILREILEKRGSKKIYDYTEDYFSVNLHTQMASRGQELIRTFSLSL
jgi:hypothetical protein